MTSLVQIIGEASYREIARNAAIKQPSTHHRAVQVAVSGLDHESKTMIRLMDTFNHRAFAVYEAELDVIRARAILESKEQLLKQVKQKFRDAGDAVKNAGTPP